jgi:hypothetical protein
MGNSNGKPVVFTDEGLFDDLLLSDRSRKRAIAFPHPPRQVLGVEALYLDARFARN